MKRSFSVGLLLAGLLLPAYLIAADAPINPGIAIHPAPALTADELATLLDAHVWTLNLSLPPGAKQVIVTPQLVYGGIYKARGDTQLYPTAVMDVPSDGNRRMVVAVIPLGVSLSAADRIRVVVDIFGDAFDSEVDNPLKGLGCASAPLPQKVSDGVYNLIGGAKGPEINGLISQDDVIISLKIETK